MRYVHSDEFAESTLELAEALFERFVGKRLAVEKYEETIRVARNEGRLTNAPVREVVSVTAFCDNYEDSAVLGPVRRDVPINEVSERGGHIVLPLALFGVSYTSATVVYLAGYDEAPADVQTCVLEIARLIADGAMDEWSGYSALSEPAQATITKYREGR